MLNLPKLRRIVNREIDYHRKMSIEADDSLRRLATQGRDRTGAIRRLEEKLDRHENLVAALADVVGILERLESNPGVCAEIGIEAISLTQTNFGMARSSRQTDPASNVLLGKQQSQQCDPLFDDKEWPAQDRIKRRILHVFSDGSPRNTEMALAAYKAIVGSEEMLQLTHESMYKRISLLAGNGFLIKAHVAKRGGFFRLASTAS